MDSNASPTQLNELPLGLSYVVAGQGDCWVGGALNQQDAIAAARMRCHLLIETLPGDGLKEAEESLNGMCDFYLTPYSAVPLPPPSREVSGHVVERYTRPVFPVSVED